MHWSYVFPALSHRYLLLPGVACEVCHKTHLHGEPNSGQINHEKHRLAFLASLDISEVSTQQLQCRSQFFDLKECVNLRRFWAKNIMYVKAKHLTYPFDQGFTWCPCCPKDRPWEIKNDVYICLSQTFFIYTSPNLEFPSVISTYSCLIFIGA